MTRAERTIVEHWRGLATVCAIVALFGIAWATWHRIDSSDRNYAAAAKEADKRGDAVSTLAGDVRALRAQVQAEGKTPIAPDPSKAVPSLSARAEVPVPIPGPRGPVGSTGPSGSPGKSGETGASGAPGVVGPTGPAGVQGEQGATGPQGERGDKGDTGDRGPAGPACPDGYSLQAPSYDPDALVCRKNGAPDPGDGGEPSPLAMGLDPRRQYA